MGTEYIDEAQPEVNFPIETNTRTLAEFMNMAAGVGRTERAVYLRRPKIRKTAVYLSVWAQWLRATYVWYQPMRTYAKP
eukprot:4584907-Pyramimonas_sp.AAC.1